MNEPFIQDPDVTVYVGDALQTLRTLRPESVDCVVTSPPYWALRDYGTEGQLGLEKSPDDYVAHLVEVFMEVRRVLVLSGTVWLNLGDTYKDKDLVGIPWRVAFGLQKAGWRLRSAIIWAKANPIPESILDRPTCSHEYLFLLSKDTRYFYDSFAVREPAEWKRWGDQTSPKYQDRPGVKGHSIAPRTLEELDLEKRRVAGRNMRDVWFMPTQPYPEAHFATYPEELVRRCILAGCPELVCRMCGKPRERIVERIVPDDPGRGDGSKLRDAQGLSAKAASTAKRQLGQAYQDQLDANPPQTTGWTDCGHDDYRAGIVLDPFIGSGTTALVARKERRHAVGIEISEEYARDLLAGRLAQQSLFA